MTWGSASGSTTSRASYGWVSLEVSPLLANDAASTVRMRTYKAYRDLLASERWLRLAGAGARPQRLLWASTGNKDPAAPDTLYVEALAKSWGALLSRIKEKSSQPTA